MVETSEVSLERADRLEQLARLKSSAYASAALEEIKILRRQYEANLGRSLMKTRGPVPQEEIDFKRGFYEGLLWGWTTFIENAEPKLAKLEEALAELKE